MTTIHVEEFYYPDGSPIASEDSSSDTEETEPFIPEGETIPLWIYLPDTSTVKRETTPILIRFSVDNEKQKKQMLAEVEALYGIYGSSIFGAFVDGMTKSDTGATKRTHHELGQEPVEETIPSPSYSNLLSSFGQARDALNDRIQKELIELQKAAKDSALSRLKESKSEIRGEAKRYLSLLSVDDARAEAALAASALTTQLSGPDAAKLMQAMLEIQQLMDEIESAKERLISAMSRGHEERLAIMRGLVDFFGPSDEIVRAAAPVEARRVQALESALTSLLATHCDSFAILYRVAAEVRLPDDITFELQPGGVGNYVAKSKNPDALQRFNDAVYNKLKDAWQAANELIEDISSKPELVWHYPKIIEQVLVEKDVEPDSIIARAAEEKMDKAQGPTASSIVATDAGLIELIVILAGASPPVAAFVGVISVLLSVPEIIEIYLYTRQQRFAYRAVLDPDRSLAAADRSYVEFLFSLVSLVPVYSNLRVLRYGL